MTGPELELVSRWYGVFLYRGAALAEERRYPEDPEALRARLRLRRQGELTEEESAILRTAAQERPSTHDRRFESRGALLFPRGGEAIGRRLTGPSREVQRRLLLEEGEASLLASWDPSVHLQESVRAISELDHVLNMLGERLMSWASRDIRGAEAADEGSVHSVAVALVEGSAPSEAALGPPDPATQEARVRLARLYLDATRTRNEIEQTLIEAVPRRLPNLSALLGPLLAARMVAQAGGLDRLARLPASTVQVLGAETAFFEHLRGRGPPPRHGLLFLHPEIQGRPRRDRGKLARALAGKTVIAARLDREGTAIRPELLATFLARAAAIRTQSKKRTKPAPAPTPST